MSAQQSARDLVLVFFVAVTVALVSTLAGSVLDHIHQVNAEDLDAVTTPATVTGATQTLVIKPWGVKLVLPLATELPLVSYANQGNSSVGLSAADLARLSPACSASHNALGTFIRYPLGGFAKSPHPTTIEYFMGAVGNYEFSYRLPPSLCQNSVQAGAIINRETSAINTSLGSLASINN